MLKQFITRGDSMQDLNRKIFAIQDDLETFSTVIKKIKNTEDNVLVTNCISRLRIGDKNIHVIFDTVLYNDSNNILVMLRDSSQISRETFIESLNNNNIKYNEVKFRDYLHFKKPETDKELFFASNSNNLKYALKDSMDKGNEECTYYPAAIGHFKIRYFYDREKQEELDDYYIKGIIELEDKYILIVCSKKEDDLYYKKIMTELEKSGIKVSMDYSREIEEPTREKVLNKKEKGYYDEI